MTAPQVRLFVKSYCGWCHEAEAWLGQRGIPFRRLDVLEDRDAYQEMRSLSGQTRTPTLEVDGEVLPDFDVDELEAFLKDIRFPMPPAAGPTP